MDNGNDINNKVLDFDRALGNLIVPLPELVGSCVAAKAILLDLLSDTDEAEEIEGIKFISFILSICTDFFEDAMEESNAKLTAARLARDLTKFREYLTNMINDKK